MKQNKKFWFTESPNTALNIVSMDVKTTEERKKEKKNKTINNKQTKTTTITHEKKVKS